ncbi:putative phage lysozyme [Basidiobolus meristosporus CBS 931.73]|uniref:Putative phage lysozyme n=1 Tax=Basidiobolus meristosporus CBS 931.73 TaxID=1314790 RepID=A0A1Y1Y216_9FUNG|nr:putative phage lysozyme [Basidiobolus meristosporus CBS 931.73]|eukprot:ORX92057.1 putative phage lysozyme [Basidiobolus meristosporus CBS 931.73]
MQFSSKGENLLKAIEVLSLQPYDDQKGLSSAPIKSWVAGATIGYGHLIPSSQWSKYKNGITKAEADALFQADLKPFVQAVNDSVKVKLQQQFDACVLLCFNIGASAFKTSSVVKILNGQTTTYPSLEAAWKAWNKSQGKVSAGLVNRRNAEWKIYTQGIYEKW